MSSSSRPSIQSPPPLPDSHHGHHPPNPRHGLAHNPRGISTAPATHSQHQQLLDAATELLQKQSRADDPSDHSDISAAASSAASSAAASATTPKLDSTPRLSASPVQFRSRTIAPSPPAPQLPTAPARTASRSPSPSFTSPLASPAEPSSSSYPAAPSRALSSVFRPSSLGAGAPPMHAGLHPTSPPLPDASSTAFATPCRASRRPAPTLQHKTSAASLHPISRTPSLKTGGFSGHFGSASAASSTVPSPVISAMGDVTPLPSPLLATDSPGPWRRRASREIPALHFPQADQTLANAYTEHEPASATPTRPAKKGYAALHSDHGSSGNSHQGHSLTHPPIHTRNRSISDYKPDPMLIPKRTSTVSGKGDHKNVIEAPMRREPHLSEARGLTPIEKPPTPPPSESSLSANDSSSAVGSSSGSSKRAPVEYFEAFGRYDRKRRRWRAIKHLGQGTFSRVMLATSQITSHADDEDYGFEPLNRYERRTLVAVKVCEHGPRGGASEDRIEMSLKRELEIMQTIRHPSIVNLKAWSIEPSRAILVLSYYPGGDLFDVARDCREALTPPLLRRIFAELVGAVSYLHENKIVHRDIKLENVLVNLPKSELLSPDTEWQTYAYPVITLTDLGLSRRVEDGEKLETRCGSDDYAAPEVIMGQPYDGRATDAWSLGVLLYALLESRLPFDPLPVGDYAHQVRMRSRTSHRIARVEWRWIEYGVQDGEDGEGDHEADTARFKAKGLLGAMEVVEALLKRARSRWPLEKVAATEWVSGGIQVEGGIKFREEEEGEEVVS